MIAVNLFHDALSALGWLFAAGTTLGCVMLLEEAYEGWYQRHHDTTITIADDGAAYPGCTLEITEASGQKRVYLVKAIEGTSLRVRRQRTRS